MSYSKDKSDYITNDTQATRDSYEFLKKWFEAYPGFVGHDLYLSGRLCNPGGFRDSFRFFCICNLPSALLKNKLWTKHETKRVK